MTQIPVDAVDAGAARLAQIVAGDLAHLRARAVADAQRDIGLRLRQVVADRRAIGRVLPEERLVGDEAAIVGRVELHAAAHVEQERIGLHRLRLLLQRRDVVEDPDAAAVRGDDHVVVARVNDDLVNRHRRQVRLDAQPAAAAIGADEQPELRSRIQHARVLRILGHRRHGVALRNAFADRTEVVAAVDAGIHIGAVIVGTMVVEGRIHDVHVVRGRRQARHIRIRRHALEPVGDVGPGLAVLRHVHLAVVGAGIEHAGVLRRFDQLHDVAVGLHAVVSGDGDLLAGDAHQPQVVAIGRGREIGADRRPRLAAIGGLEHHVGADINGRRIVRRHQDRRVPVPAQRRFAARRQRADRLALVADLVDARDVAVLRLGVDDARVRRIDLRFEAVAAVDLEPLIVGDAGAAARGRRPAPRVVVLQAAAHVVGRSPCRR